VADWEDQKKKVEEKVGKTRRGVDREIKKGKMIKE